MHHFKRLFTAIFLTAMSVVLLYSAALVYLIVTPLGGKLLMRYIKQQFVSVGLIHVGHYEGTLQNGFVLKDIQIKGLSYLPDALLRVQEIDVRLPLWQVPLLQIPILQLLNPDIAIFNARIFIPNSDPVVFTGKISEGQINGNLYAKSLDLHAASRFWATEDLKMNLQGFASNIDFKVQGPLSSPKVNGSFMVDSIRYKSILLTNALSGVNVTLIFPLRQFQMKGEVDVNSGLVNVRKVNLHLTSSKFIFAGDALNPVMYIHLGAKVEDMYIHLAINGPLDHPQLLISSDPPMASQDALRVLFTGNAWAFSTSPFNGVTSSQLAENFLNYSLQDFNDQQQLGFKTKLTDNLKLGAEMDQRPLPPGETNTYYTRKVNGEMDLTDHTSLNISHDVLPQDNYSYSSSQDAQQQQSETQIYVQYKKRF